MPQEDPPPWNSGITGISEDPNIILVVPYSHYYRVGGPLNQYEPLERTLPLHPRNFPAEWGAANVKTGRPLHSLGSEGSGCRVIELLSKSTPARATSPQYGGFRAQNYCQ